MQRWLTWWEISRSCKRQKNKCWFTLITYDAQQSEITLLHFFPWQRGHFTITKKKLNLIGEKIKGKNNFGNENPIMVPASWIYRKMLMIWKQVRMVYCDLLARLPSVLLPLKMALGKYSCLCGSEMQAWILAMMIWSKTEVPLPLCLEDYLLPCFWMSHVCQLLVFPISCWFCAPLGKWKTPMLVVVALGGGCNSSF